MLEDLSYGESIVHLEWAPILDSGSEDGEREESIVVGEQGSWLPCSASCPKVRSSLGAVHTCFACYCKSLGLVSLA